MKLLQAPEVPHGRGDSSRGQATWRHGLGGHRHEDPLPLCSLAAPLGQVPEGTQAALSNRSGGSPPGEDSVSDHRGGVGLARPRSRHPWQTPPPGKLPPGSKADTRIQGCQPGANCK